jgi:hypothetical protein
MRSNAIAPQPDASGMPPQAINLIALAKWELQLTGKIA